MSIDKTPYTLQYLGIMHLYFSGIGGSGLSPLAHISIDCGFAVSGSDREFSGNLVDLEARGAQYSLEQSQVEIAKIHQKNPIDWIVVTSALPENHPHILFAKQYGIKISKRHDLINLILEQKQLKLIAVAGTHGKTTTTSMITWLFKELYIPVSYLIGTNISYGRSGEYALGSQYLVYECDEFDRNMLNFHPDITVVPSLDFDHPDTYKDDFDYVSSFAKFFSQSKTIVSWESILEYIESIYKKNNGDFKSVITDQELFFLEDSKKEQQDLFLTNQFITLAGQNTRKNAVLCLFVLCNLLQAEESLIMEAMNKFPSVDRRFQKLSDNLYSDYGHHPVEIASTIQMAQEMLVGDQKLVLVYQPHQNIRQHEEEIQEGYKTCFENADQVFWLPTYLSRENDLAVLTPEDLLRISNNINSKFIISQFDNNLRSKLKNHLKDGNYVLIMGAGSIDEWARVNLV
jgi:UDP-N-acetylmuramate--alanine ligase